MGRHAVYIGETLFQQNETNQQQKVKTVSFRHSFTGYGVHGTSNTKALDWPRFNKDLLGSTASAHREAGFGLPRLKSAKHRQINRIDSSHPARCRLSPHYFDIPIVNLTNIFKFPSYGRLLDQGFNFAHTPSCLLAKCTE